MTEQAPSGLAERVADLITASDGALAAHGDQKTRILSRAINDASDELDFLNDELELIWMAAGALDSPDREAFRTCLANAQQRLARANKALMGGKQEALNPTEGEQA